MVPAVTRRGRPRRVREAKNPGPAAQPRISRSRLPGSGAIGYNPTLPRPPRIASPDRQHPPGQPSAPVPAAGSGKAARAGTHAGRLRAQAHHLNLRQRRTACAGGGSRGTERPARCAVELGIRCRSGTAAVVSGRHAVNVREDLAGRTLTIRARVMRAWHAVRCRAS